MKAKIRKTGEIVNVTRNEYGLYVDENCVGYRLESLDFGNEEDEHWKDVRERAAIAAMQATITFLSSSDRSVYREVVIEGFKGNKRTYPNEIADEIAEFAVACADALVKQLKEKQHETEKMD